MVVIFFWEWCNPEAREIGDGSLTLVRVAAAVQLPPDRSGRKRIITTCHFQLLVGNGGIKEGGR